MPAALLLGLWVAAAPALGLANPCLNQSLPFAKQKWCDVTQPIDVRVADMISRMPLPEKIASLASSNNAVPSLGLPSYSWRSEANNGIDYFSHGPLTPHSTKFAWPTTTAMAFNRSLFHAQGAQIGREARAMANVGNAGGTFWHPVVNLAREPRWGRNYEVCPPDADATPPP